MKARQFVKRHWLPLLAFVLSLVALVLNVVVLIVVTR
jgi:hypothetical protein